MHRFCPTIVLVAALTSACSDPDRSPPMDDVTAEVTFNNQISRLLQEHCQSCHRPDGHAPFALMSYDEVAALAPLIKSAVQERRMPQGRSMRLHTDCTDGETFLGPRRLTDDEIATFTAWVDDGAPEGLAADLPPPREFDTPAEWVAGPPAMVVRNAPSGFAVPGGLGRDLFRRFVIKTDFGDDRFLTGFEAHPGVTSGARLSRVVHHVTLFIDPSGGSVQQEADFQASNPEVPGPGFEGEFTYPTQLVGMWFPGAPPLALTDGLGVRVPPGACIVMEVHYAGDHAGVVDETEVGLHFESAVSNEIVSSLVKNEQFTIPAGMDAVHVDAMRPLPAGATLYAITPHMHQLGTDFLSVAQLPDGTERCLGDVDWDFEHQGTYWLREPIALPPGTLVRTTCLYDNSAANPSQFNDPPQDIVFGRAADHEMCQLTLTTNPLPPAMPPAGVLAINEVLADPPPGFDANGDGTASTQQDEFVELVNVGTGPLDLSGATIADAFGVRFTFPSGTVLAPGDVAVVFGGGSPAPAEDVLVLAASGLALSNDGDVLTVTDTQGKQLAQVSWSDEGGQDQSIVRATEPSATAALVLHRTVSDEPASPGRRADGSAF